MGLQGACGVDRFTASWALCRPSGWQKPPQCWWRIITARVPSVLSKSDWESTDATFFAAVATGRTARAVALEWEAASWMVATRHGLAGASEGAGRSAAMASRVVLTRGAARLAMWR